MYISLHDTEKKELYYLEDKLCSETSYLCVSLLSLTLSLTHPTYLLLLEYFLKKKILSQLIKCKK